MGRMVSMTCLRCLCKQRSRIDTEDAAMIERNTKEITLTILSEHPAQYRTSRRCNKTTNARWTKGKGATSRMHRPNFKDLCRTSAGKVSCIATKDDQDDSLSEEHRRGLPAPPIVRPMYDARDR